MNVMRLFFRLLLLLGKGVFHVLRLLGLGVLVSGRWSLRQGGGRYSRRSGSHGTARFAYAWEIWWGGALSGSGPILGKGRFGKLLRFSKDGILHVFAATGAGKGLGIVIPTLLTYRGSVFVTDPKGENFAITQRRRRKFGKVYMLSPTDLAASARFNPLDIIRKGTSLEADDAGVLARYMHRPDAREAHWDDRAISLLTALVLHALHAADPALRTLAYVRTLSVGGPETMLDTLKDIATASPSLKAREVASGFLGTMGEGREREAGEFKSVLANVQKATEVWSAGAGGGVLSTHSTFDLNELVTETATLYLCVDEEYLDVYERWLRVMAGCMLTTVMRAKRLPRSRRKVLLLLDEVAALGPLDVLERNAGLLRAYCTPVLIWQHLLQAYAVYGERRGAAFLANASARVFFGVNDNDTAEAAARMLGNATILSASEGVSQASDAWLRQQHSSNRSEGGYWLLDPAEVQRLPANRMLIRLPRVRYPIFTKRLNYRWRLRWWGRFDRWRPGLKGSVSAQPTAAAAPLPVPAAAPTAAPTPVAAAIPPHVRRPPPPRNAASQP